MNLPPTLPWKGLFSTVWCMKRQIAAGEPKQKKRILSYKELLRIKAAPCCFQIWSLLRKLVFFFRSPIWNSSSDLQALISSTLGVVDKRVSVLPVQLFTSVALALRRTSPLPVHVLFMAFFYNATPKRSPVESSTALLQSIWNQEVPLWLNPCLFTFSICTGIGGWRETEMPFCVLSLWDC